MGRGFLIALVLMADVAQAAAPVGPSEIGVDVGVTGVVQSYEGGGTTDLLGAFTLRGRTRFVGWLTLDGWAHAQPAYSPDLAQSSFSIALRPGIEFEHFGLSIGPVAQLTPGSANLAQWLPSLTLWGGAGPWRGVLGLFDRPELPILRVGIQYGNYSLSYVLLGGAELSGRWTLTDVLALEARVLVSMQPLGNGLGTATVGITWTPGGRR